MACENTPCDKRGAIIPCIVAVVAVVAIALADVVGWYQSTGELPW